jgi:cytochrome c553
MYGMAFFESALRFFALGVAGLALTGLGASAQTPLTRGDEARPLYATSDDIREGKELAETTCVKCHGPAGISTIPGIPDLAGQRPSYIYRELKAYQIGARPGGDQVHNMNLMKFFSDDALAKVAAYYSSLDPAPPPEGPAPKYDDPVAAGQAASAPCAKCHGDIGISHKEGVPSLIGISPKYLFETMQAYKQGDRPIDDKNADMKKALDALSDRDLQNIALFYALQNERLTRAQTEGPPQTPVAKDTLAVCAKCHGETGVSSSAATPSIAGQDATYLLNALRAYKDGTREDDTMGPKAKKLDDVEMTNLAAFFAGQTPQPANVPRPLSPADWADRCNRCHGVDGNSMRPDVPAIAGQRIDYLEKALKAYRKGDRKSPEMDAMASILTDEDIKGIAAHYAFQKGRPAVFITVPSMPSK